MNYPLTIAYWNAEEGQAAEPPAVGRNQKIMDANMTNNENLNKGEEPYFLQSISFAEEDNTRSFEIDYCMKSNYLKPKIITEILGIIPERSWAKGDIRISNIRNIKTNQIEQKETVYPEGLWAINSKHYTNEIIAQKHAECLLELLEPKIGQINEIRRKTKNITCRFYFRYEPIGDWGSYELRYEIIDRLNKFSDYIEFGFIGFHIDKK